jgi:hypothetical protein
MTTSLDDAHHSAPQAAGIVASRLGASPYRELRNLRCEYHDGVLTLRGRLPLFYHKQLAQQAFVGFEEVVRFEDQIEVAS